MRVEGSLQSNYKVPTMLQRQNRFSEWDGGGEKLLEIFNSPATQGLRQVPPPASRLGTPCPFRLVQKGLSRSLHMVIFRRPNRRPYKFHSVISPLVIASRPRRARPIIMLAALPAY